jgi:hypothetical protein
MGKAHKRTVKITRDSGQCVGSGSISIRDRYPGCFMPQESNLLSILLPELPNSQKCLILKLKTITVEQIMKILT